jgi:hypothetical protein
LESLAQAIASGEIVWAEGLRSIRNKRPPRRYFNSALQSLFAHVMFMVLASVTYSRLLTLVRTQRGRKGLARKNAMWGEKNKLSFSPLAGEREFDLRIESQELREERSPSRRFSIAEKALTNP